MKIKLVSTLAAAALLSGAGLAQAQDRGQQNFDRPAWSERMDGDRDRGRDWGDREQRARSDRRAEDLLRNVLREAGFSNIRILDAAYLVQVRAPDGRNVTMFFDPPRRDVGRGMVRQDDRWGLAGRMDDEGMSERMQEQMERMQEELEQMRGGMQGRMQEHMEGRMQDRMQDRMAARDPRTKADREPPTAMQWTEPFDLDTTEEARLLLRVRGMKNIRDLERIGENEVAATADWYGEEVDVEVNVRTGEIIQPQRMSESQIRNRLEERGWQDVRDVQRDEDKFQVTADREGQSFELIVDAQTGLLLRWREAG